MNSTVIYAMNFMKFSNHIFFYYRFILVASYFIQTLNRPKILFII